MSETNVVRYGCIVWADVNDPNGNPVGEHPVIILTKQPDIDAGKTLVGVVCTTSFRYPLQSGWFEMPSEPCPGGHEITGLDQACVAKATWIEPIAKVNRVGKRCPKTIIRQIEQWLHDKKRDADRKKHERPRGE